ncbi:glycosyltransferase [Thermosulfurimonas dismutans]|uniref:Glycosyltransferase family 1 protein n=1 Tax=Thermosulfurimonas dismutans TaxID=999894 RepID=A0A179D6Z9_9BACT|nr:glycosyltransferase [Thermosulfurimonas dismutans]OAQ21826.1 hypothetical protein TDIS_0344 [Thermosulfurimonas dismutans]
MSARKTVALVVDRAERTGAYRPYLLRFLREKGYRVLVIVLDQDLRKCKVSPPEVEVVSLGLLPRDYRRFKPVVFWKLKSVLEREEVQVAWVQKYRLALCLSLLKWRLPYLKIIFHLVNVDIFRNRLRRIGWHFLRRQVAFWVANSYGVLEDLPGASLPGDNMRVIFNGVDLERFVEGPSKAEVRRIFNLPEGGFLIGMLARFRKEKDQEGLLKGFAELRARGAEDSYLVLAGGGPKKETLAEMVNRLALRERVFLMDRISPAEVPAFLRALDVFAHPTWREGMPNAVLEAMAAGLPVVVTDAPGLPEIFDCPYRFGYMVPRGDVSALAKALWELYRLSPAERETLGRLAQRRVEEAFTIERMAREFLEVFDHLTGGAHTVS